VVAWEQSNFKLPRTAWDRIPSNEECVLRRGIGRVSVEEARLFASTDDFFVRPGSDLVTTREVLAEEAALLATVKAGQEDMRN
jgi:hypothetical protein